QSGLSRGLSVSRPANRECRPHRHEIPAKSRFDLAPAKSRPAPPLQTNHPAWLLGAPHLLPRWRSRERKALLGADGRLRSRGRLVADRLLVGFMSPSPQIPPSSPGAIAPLGAPCL